MSGSENEDFNDSDILAGVFEERAENLSKQELNAWTQETPRGKEILVKLKGPGAKLLSGPRGCGKSTFLRRAYFDLLESGDVLSIYVNYARSLALEPLFHHRANALQIFRQWVLAKIVVGAKGSFVALGKLLPQTLQRLSTSAERLIHDLETGEFAELPNDLLSPSDLLQFLESWTKDFGFKRSVLLMDDAAHAFSSEQQREFFEIFRLLRSRLIAAKAAVYPGITSYSPNFHVGHEAELIEAWHEPEGANYLATMRMLLQRRLPAHLYAQLSERGEYIDYLALASFGLPRGFLNMVQQMLAVEETSVSARVTRADADEAVKDYADSVRGIFLALKSKLPRFKNFITAGLGVERGMTGALRLFNEGRDVEQKAVVVAISEPLEQELERIMGLLEYSGLVRTLDRVSRGIKGVFRRYAVHYAVILVENSLNLGRSYSIETAVKALSRRDAHAFVRVRGVTLLGQDFQQRCRLELPACQNCGSPRVSEDQRFCMKCGAQLADSSIYADLVRASIVKLPLTKRKVDDLKEHTSIRTVQDILLDDDMQQIRSVPYIGSVWARKIRNAAEEYVSV